MPVRRTGAPTQLYRYAGVGMQYAATIGVFAVLGYWLDGKLGSGPWLLLTGVFVGFGLGLVSLVSKLGPKRDKSSSTHAPPDDDDPPQPR
jgi:F0F1-type ATP synthase assembly protein I